MAVAAPTRLSGLANLLLRRPPSLRELVMLVGYADDYAWFVWLVRRLFPQEAEAALSAPDVRGRVERFANLFGERHFPLYAPYFEFYLTEEEEPAFTALRRGIPFDLMGFGYDGLHEMWDGYREGLSAMALLVKPADAYYEGPDGIRVAWLESAAERIPQETLERIPQGGIPLDDLTEALKGTRFEGAAQACSWVLAETGNFFLDQHLRGRVVRRLLRPLGATPALTSGHTTIAGPLQPAQIPGGLLLGDGPGRKGRAAQRVRPLL